MSKLTPKNGKVEANIYRRGPYQYQVRLTVAGRHFNRTFESLESARGFRDKITACQGRDRALDKLHKAGTTTLGEVCDRYTRDVTRDKVSWRSELSVYAIQRREFPWLYERPLDAIEADDISTVKKAIREGAGGRGPRSAATVNSHLDKLSILFEWARSDEGLGLDALANPCASVKRLSKRRPRRRRLSHVEMQKLVDAAVEYEARPLCRVRCRAALLFLLETGLRPGEMANTCWDDVDWEAHCLLITGRSDSHPDSRGGSKTGDQRTVILTPMAVSLLHEIEPAENGRIFGPNPATICQALERVIDRSGVQNFRGHDCRHEYISRQFELGLLSDMEIAQQVGHTDPKTLSGYAHLRSKAVRHKLAGLQSISGFDSG